MQHGLERVSRAAHALENVAGTLHEHMRAVIVANGMAAVVDLSANTAMSWRAASPTMLASLNSMNVVQGSAATASALQGSPVTAQLRPA